MIFLLFLTLIFGAVALMSYHLISFDSPISIAVAVIQCIAAVISFIVVIRMFRNQRGNYKTGFYAIGVLIASSVPALIYLIFGFLFMITGISVFAYIGWTLAGLVFMGILNGIFRGRWNWKVKTVELEFENLPADLDGLKVVQFSDAHIGSFFNQYSRVQKAIDLINSREADYILFTGDLVNNLASEMKGWEPIFRQLKAKRGKFSILGNHDYADYMRWENKADKDNNLNDLIQIHRDIDFTPLLNESIEISDQENKAFIIGVENWGTGGFRKSGDLKKALENVPENSFRLLMSHDPSHFDEEVVGTGIDLTLSGHTHGMQFGIERFGIRFSPVQFRYKKWAGLYNVGKQFLYVNRGFGYIGFPGRVGIYPEITEIILRKK